MMILFRENPHVKIIVRVKKDLTGIFFWALPESSPHPTFAQLIPLFRTPKMTFYVYDRKNTDNDYDGCNDNCDDNFDDNGGNFDDSGDKK